MLDAIKHITDDNFFFQEDSAQTCIVCVTQSNWVKHVIFVLFCVLPDSAVAHVVWGGIVKCLLIAYFISNISAKKYQNPFMCVKVIASQRWDVFWDTVYIITQYNINKVRNQYNNTVITDIKICTENKIMTFFKKIVAYRK